MQGDQKITPLHLERRAIVYLRQSSEGQVLNNLESQRLQYAMADRAKTLGFCEVEVIDVDLGSSAAMAAKRREGFERMLERPRESAKVVLFPDPAELEAAKKRMAAK